MIIRSLPAFFVLMLPLATCKTGYGQDQTASPPAQAGEFPEITLSGPIFQPLAAAGKNHVLVGGKGSKETAFTLYDLTTGQKVSQFTGQEIVPPIALSPDGKTLAGVPSHLQKDKIILIDTASGRTKATLGIEKVADKVLFLNNERMATAAIWEKTALIWDLSTGKKIEQINFSHSARANQLPLMFSPDGKKALFLRENQIHLLQIDTKETTQIGVLEQKHPYERTVVAMAFSTDGTEAVFLVEALGKQSLQTWNLDKKTHGPQVEFPATGPSFYQGERLTPCPDGRGYLVNGNTLVERQSLKKLWALPASKPGSPSQVFPTAVNRVLRLEPFRQNLRMAEHSHPKEVLDQAIELTRQGKDPRDALLSAGHANRRKNAKTFAIPLGGVPWKVSSPAKMETDGLAARPFPIGYPSLQVGQVWFASASAGVVGIEHLDQPGFGQTGAVGVDLYHLGSGRKISQVEFSRPSQMVALSAAGDQILASEPDSGGRLDLYDMKGNKGKRVTSWKPLEDGNAEAEPKLTFAAFTVNDQVLTIDQTRTATVWQAPEMKAKVYVEFARLSQPLLSHDRKMLFFLDGDLPRAFQTDTLQPMGDGEPIRNLPKSTVPLVARNLTLSSDGAELTGLFQWGTFGSRFFLARWDLRTGKSLGGFDFQAPVLQSSLRGDVPLQYAGRFYLVNNQFLIDRESHAVVWVYTANMMMGRTLAQPQDERLWFLQSPGLQQPALLTTTELPERTTREIIRRIQKSENLAVRPDSLVSIKLSLGPKETDNALREKLAKGMEQALKRAGLIFLEEAPLTWQLELKETDTGKTRVIHRLGSTNPEVTKLFELEGKFTLVRGSQTFWTSPPMKWSMQIGRIPAEEKNPQEFLRNKLWEAAQSWALGMTPPGRILFWEGQYHSLPGISQLTTNGWAMGTGK